jgi:hypothetical protein
VERLGVHDFYVLAGWRFLLKVRKSLAQAEEFVFLGVGLGAALLGQEVDRRRDSAWQMSTTQYENALHLYNMWF